MNPYEVSEELEKLATEMDYSKSLSGVGWALRLRDKIIPKVRELEDAVIQAEGADNDSAS